MTSVLGYARTFFIGGTFPQPPITTWERDISNFHELLEDLGKKFDSDAPLLDTTEEKMLQGLLSDAMTHAGQLAMLRHLARSPVPPENFTFRPTRTKGSGYLRVQRQMASVPTRPVIWPRLP
jgi:hypothetical protein